MHRLQLSAQAAFVCTTLLSHLPAAAQDRYYTEVTLEEAVNAIERGQVSPQLRSNIEGAAAALSYVYDCSTASPGFLRNLDTVNASLVEYSKTDWARLGKKYGHITVAGALHSYVTEHLRCSLRK